MSSKIAVNPK